MQFSMQLVFSYLDFDDFVFSAKCVVVHGVVVGRCCFSSFYLFFFSSHLVFFWGGLLGT
jgi:hypothetical protein